MRPQWRKLGISAKLNMRALNRITPVLQYLLGGYLLLLAGAAMATESWPRLPSDEEIDTARERLVAEMTGDYPSCQVLAAACTSEPTEVGRQMCVARACMGACRLGPEVRKSKVAEIELIKAHHPSEPSALSAHVIALLRVDVTRDDCNGKLTDEVSYLSQLLEYGDVLIPESAGAPARLGRDWVFRSEGMDSGVKQSDLSSRAQRDAVFASYFGPDRLVRGFPGERAQVPEYRLQVSASDSRHPLHFRLIVEKSESSSGAAKPDAPAQYRPAPGVRVEVSALRFEGNQQRLAGYFETAQCKNCQNNEVHGHLAQTMADPAQPIVLMTGRDGQAAIEFFLDLGALTQAGLLSSGSMIDVPTRFEVRVASAGGPLHTVAQEQQQARLDAIGVIDAVTYEPAQAFDPLSESALPRAPEQPLSSILGDEGTRDGPNMLAREQRVIVRRRGEAFIGPSGATPGRTLTSEHFLQLSDRITVNACGLVSTRMIDGLPAGDPGRIWVTVRFFDGFRGRFGVSGKVCRAGLTIGASGEDSGFKSATVRFAYWAAESGIDAAVVWLYPVYTVASYTRKVVNAILWISGRDPTYVVLQSAVSVEFDDSGTLEITTRDGEPRVYNGQTGADGIVVPAGMSARINADGNPELQATDAKRAKRADAWLMALESTPEAGGVGAHSEPNSGVDSGDENDTVAGSINSPLWPVTASDDFSWSVTLAVAIPTMLLVVWIGRRFRRPAATVKQAPARRIRDDSSKVTPAASPAAGIDKHFCGQCGKHHGAQAKFCTQCGAAISTG